MTNIDKERWKKLAGIKPSSINEHTVEFSKEEMATLHRDGKLVKADDEGKDHTYVYNESTGEINRVD
ncbi:MAG TPA: hypothetical protein DF712_01975 [Balneola sp.]|nr:hypothetical protein [Balneola sp.]|tara:strand:+ start:275 stop:475 length:201 start_codon:yes stop_codon:yes gene_type:complete